jgi:hypothetical protein
LTQTCSIPTDGRSIAFRREAAVVGKGVGSELRFSGLFIAWKFAIKRTTKSFSGIGGVGKKDLGILGSYLRV